MCYLEFREDLSLLSSGVHNPLIDALSSDVFSDRFFNFLMFRTGNTTLSDTLE